MYPAATTILSGTLATLLVLMSNGNPISPENGVIRFNLNESQHSQHDWHNSCNSPANDERVKSEIEFGNTNVCPKTISVGANLPVRSRSTCPWYYVIDHNPSRYPATILQAQSPCEFCIGSGDQLECGAMTEKVKVLLQSDFDEETGNYEYLEAEEDVTVGYTCADRRVRHAGTSSPTDDGDDYTSQTEPDWARK